MGDSVPIIIDPTSEQLATALREKIVGTIRAITDTHGEDAALEAAEAVVVAGAALVAHIGGRDCLENLLQVVSKIQDLLASDP